MRLDIEGLLMILFQLKIEGQECLDLSLGIN